MTEQISYLAILIICFFLLYFEIKDLQSQNGFLIQDHTRISGQLDRLLMPSQEEQKEKVKNGLSFWK